MNRGTSMRRPLVMLTLAVFVAIAMTSSGASTSVRWFWAIGFILFARAVRRFGVRNHESGSNRADTAWTPLHEAVNRGALLTIPELIATGIDVDARDAQGMTPLHIAVQAGSLEAIEHLIGYGADVAAVDLTHSNALVMALVSGHSDLAPALLIAGADPDQQNTYGMSARSLASEMGVPHLLTET